MLSVVFLGFSVLLIVTGAFPMWVSILFVGGGILLSIYAFSLRKSSRQTK